VLEAGSARSDLARYVGRSLAKTGHVPILIVHGEEEGEATRRLVADLVEDIAQPVRHEILPATGHYVGVRSFFGSPVVYYRPDLFKPFEDLIVEFSQEHGLENGKLTYGDTGSRAPGPKGL
jgi:hypothetical protein